jgi:hypothetical protein
MATGDDRALLTARHHQTDREEIAETFVSRWPDAFVGAVGAVEPLLGDGDRGRR